MYYYKKKHLHVVYQIVIVLFIEADLPVYLNLMFGFDIH